MDIEGEEAAYKGLIKAVVMDGRFRHPEHQCQRNADKNIWL